MGVGLGAFVADDVAATVGDDAAAAVADNVEPAVDAAGDGPEHA